MWHGRTTPFTIDVVRGSGKAGRRFFHKIQSFFTDVSPYATDSSPRARSKIDSVNNLLTRRDAGRHTIIILIRHRHRHLTNYIKPKHGSNQSSWSPRSYDVHPTMATNTNWTRRSSCASAPRLAFCLQSYEIKRRNNCCGQLFEIAASALQTGLIVFGLALEVLFIANCIYLGRIPGVRLC